MTPLKIIICAFNYILWLNLLSCFTVEKKFFDHGPRPSHCIIHYYLVQFKISAGITLQGFTIVFTNSDSGLNCLSLPSLTKIQYYHNRL